MTVPQAVVPSVAFDIPLERKDVKAKESPPVQKRLAENATSPRKSFSLQDLMKKLTAANQRRENVAAKSKAPAHNADVKRVLETSVKGDVDTLVKLESRINSKLDGANSRRKDMVKTSVEKLSSTNKEKLERGYKVLAQSESQSKELRKKVILKEELADSRRVQLTALKVEELAMNNDSKMRRGQMALELSEIQARHQGNQLEEKLISANHRREMANIFKSIQTNDSTSGKAEKLYEVRKKEEEEASLRALAIEEKMKSAEERRAKVTSETVKRLAGKTNDRIRRGAEAIQEEAKRAKDAEKTSIKKVELATERRERQLNGQQDALGRLSASKEARMEQLRLKEDAAARVMQKAIHARLLEASVRKEEILLNKSAKAAEDDAQRKEKACLAKQIELEEAMQLGREIEKKHKIASARKNKMTREARKELHELNKSKVEKVEILFTKQELKEMQKYAEIEKKTAIASAKRQENLLEIAAKSSSKKRVCSPRPSPTKGEIETKINKAAARREMFLNHRVDKASESSSSKKTINSSKLSPRADLFAAVSPRLDGSSSSRTNSPRIKAARLENFSNDAPYQGASDVNKDQQFTMLPIIATGVIALALVGVMSFMKH